MKLITVIIKSFKLEALQGALTAPGVSGLTVSQVRGFGRQRGHTEIHPGAEYKVSLLPKCKVEVLVDDALTEPAVDAIQQTARSGRIGDDEIFALDVGSAVRIRTGETGLNAI